MNQNPDVEWIFFKDCFTAVFTDAEKSSFVVEVIAYTQS